MAGQSWSLATNQPAVAAEFSSADRRPARHEPHSRPRVTLFVEISGWFAVAARIWRCGVGRPAGDESEGRPPGQTVNRLGRTRADAFRYRRAQIHKVRFGTPGETRTPNLLIRSQMLYPLSYEGTAKKVSGPGGGQDAGSLPRSIVPHGTVTSYLPVVGQSPLPTFRTRPLRAKGAACEPRHV